MWMQCVLYKSVNIFRDQCVLESTMFEMFMALDEEKMVGKYDYRVNTRDSRACSSR